MLMIETTGCQSVSSCTVEWERYRPLEIPDCNVTVARHSASGGRLPPDANDRDHRLSKRFLQIGGAHA